MVSGIIFAALVTITILTRNDLFGQRGSDGKVLVILVVLMAVSACFFLGSLLLGGGLRQGSVLASYVRLKHDEFIWLDTLDIGRNEGVEIWGEYKYGRGRSARLDCFLVGPGETVEKPPVADARTLRAIQPRRSGPGPHHYGAFPVDYGIILRPATPGRYYLGARLKSRSDDETGIEFGWCRTVSFARLRVWLWKKPELPSVELPS